MDQLLNSLPKPVLALVILTIALLILRQVQPPRTVCDAQMELFRESQKAFLYTPEKGSNGIGQVELVRTLTAQCKADNSPGGCFELFENLKKMSFDLRNIPEHCSEAAGDDPQIKKWLWSSLRLMVQIAWGSKPPASYLQKNGWFDTSEITLYCDLRRHAIRVFGNEEYKQKQEEMINELPQASTMVRDQVWYRTILSTPCDMYR